MSSEMRELVRAKIHEWRTDALEIRESDHAHRNLIAEEYEAHADELEAMLAKKPAPISGGAVITDAMVSAAYDHLCEEGVIEDAGTVAADMKVMRQALERALLARTEAGADDDKSAWCDVHKTHDQCPHTDLAVDESVRLRQLFAASQEQVRILSDMVERGQAHHERMMKLMDSAPAGSGEVDLGGWLWGKLMDFCKGRRFHPAEFNDLFAIVSELRALLRKLQQGADGWRPIESAPKEDGLKILGASNAPWTQDYYPVLVYEGYRYGSNKQYFGWQAPFDHDDRAPDPTHWMPLPAPPASQDQDGGKHG